LDIKDVAIMPLTNELELVISADNSAAIGNKKLDIVQVNDSITGYFTCRVAFLDLIRVGATPKAIVLQNFTGDSAWDCYVQGIHQLLSETSSKTLPITGSTESNFQTVQSGLGLTMIGTRRTQQTWQQVLTGEESFAVFGKPLVGNEALEQPEHIVPVQLFEQLMKVEGVVDLVPVGSTGIEAEWRQLTNRNDAVTSELDVKQSGGPATCFIVAYDPQSHAEIKRMSGIYFHELYVSESY